MTRVVVIGGGISGLASAHAILARDPRADVTVLEASARLGGNIVTDREPGLVLDGGPDSWVANKPHASALAKSLGLGGDLIETRPENRRALIAWGDSLHPLPDGFVLGVPTSLLPILRTPLFSKRAKLRMALEPFVPRRKVREGEEEDESIEAFIRRRLGAEVVERLVGPLLGGIYGGDAGKLSMRATLPQFVEIEAKHRSLIHAMKASRPKKGAPKPSMFTSLRGGVGALVDGLSAKLGDRTRTSAEVRRVSALAKDDARGRFAVELEGETLLADDVVLAVPANVARRMLTAFGEELGGLLGAMPYVSTTVVLMAFAASDVAYPLDATGYIVPRTLGRSALAATWITSKWAGRAPDGRVLVRVFLGGDGRDDLVERDDAHLTRLARAELTGTMAITAAPQLTRVYRFAKRSPQPLVGHPARMKRVRELLAATPGIHLVASGYDGVGIPDCVRQAEGAAAAIVSAPPTP